MIKRIVLSVFMAVALFAITSPAQAAGNANPEYNITIKDHIFSPPVIEIPAKKRVKLVIDNQDPTPEEFESHSLKAEKVIPGNSKGIVYVGPLKPGEYKYVGEFNEKTAKGTITVK